MTKEELTKEELIQAIKDNPDAELMVTHSEWCEEVHIGKDVYVDVEFLTLYNDELYINEDDLREKLEADLYVDGMTDEKLIELVDKEIEKYTFKKYITIC